MIESEYLEFVPAFIEGNKTGRWIVKSRGAVLRLGVIQWFGRWRQYCFFPEGETVWSKGCLEDINKFIEENKRFRIIK